ncbi:MAG: deoxyhypusine synthase family protein [bacterium]|nr:deoxyhypusine synthase family protein [bacterium]
MKPFAKPPPNENGFAAMPPLSAAERKRKRELLTRPTKPVRIRRGTTVADLVTQYADASIQARNLGSVARVMEKMLTDPKRPTVYLGLAGPLIAAGLRQVIRDLVASGCVDVVVSTGAILYQDLYQARGGTHWRGTPDADDATLHGLRVDRIYDTYVDEELFWEFDSWCGRIADEMPEGAYSSRAYLAELAKRLDDPESILVTCRKRGVPVFSPALNDSSIGIGLTEHRLRMRRQGRAGIRIDSIADNHEIVQTMVRSRATAAVYVAGGVPKNWINDGVVMSYLFGRERGHDYAVQVTADAPHWGGLSGSTLDEAKSWGKVGEHAATAMCFVEPSVSLPLVAGYVLQKRLGTKRPRLRWTWDGEELVGLETRTRGR